MSPTLHHGDRLLVTRYWPAMWLKKGQVVLLKRYSSLLIKRVVGLPGEMFMPSFADRDNVSRLGYCSYGNSSHIRFIPDGYVFVQGDNPNSIDSRNWGPIPLSSIVGHAILKLPRKAEITVSEPVPANSLSGLRLSQSAQAFYAVTLTGESVHLSDYAGHNLALVFFSPTCPTSQWLWSRLNDLHSQAAAAGVEILAVSLGDVAVTHGMAQANALALPILLAPPAENPIRDDYAITALPFSCLVGLEGYIQGAWYVMTDFPDLIWKGHEKPGF